MRPACAHRKDLERPINRLTLCSASYSSHVGKMHDMEIVNYTEKIVHSKKLSMFAYQFTLAFESTFPPQVTQSAHHNRLDSKKAAFADPVKSAAQMKASKDAASPAAVVQVCLSIFFRSRLP